MTTSFDHILGGRIVLEQPRHGYRAATDPVLLAAACAARPGEVVLDAGCGVGAAALCLAARLPGVVLHGIEIQPAQADLAMANAAANGVALTVHRGDLANPPPALKALSFDQVVTNPPFFPQHDQGSPRADRDTARREGALDLAQWTTACLRRLRQGGWLTVIHRIERLPDLLAALGGQAGAIAVRPLVAREGRPAKRFVLRARKDSAGPFSLATPLVMHDGISHGNDCDDHSAAARAILRDGAALSFDASPWSNIPPIDPLQYTDK